MFCLYLAYKQPKYFSRSFCIERSHWTYIKVVPRATFWIQSQLFACHFPIIVRVNWRSKFQLNLVWALACILYYIVLLRMHECVYEFIPLQVSFAHFIESSHHFQFKKYITLYNWNSANVGNTLQGNWLQKLILFPALIYKIPL